MTALLSFLYIFLLAAANTGAGLLFLRPLLDRTPLKNGERLLFGFGFGALVLHYLVWIVGSFRYDTASMAGLFAAWCLTGLAGVWLNRQDLDIAGRFREGNCIWLPLAAIAGLFLFSLAGSLAPPSDFDSLSYHLASPKLDLELGQIEGRTGRLPQFLFPQLMEHQFRLALALVGDSGAQMTHALFGLAAALGCAALALRLGAGLMVALIGAVMFMLVRNVVWEAATCYVDLALTFYFLLSTVTLTYWRERPTAALAILIGISTGAGIMVKFLGFALAVSIALVFVFSIPRHRMTTVTGALVSGIVALTIIAPLLLRNWILFENPLFPAFEALFAPHRVDLLAGMTGIYARDSLAISLLMAPWDVFINTSRFFDGHQIGAPYLLVLAPFGFLVKGPHRPIIAILLGSYFILWFFSLTQQVRFLLPAFGLLAAIAALGLERVWQAAGPVPAARAVIIGAMSLFLLNQSMFVAAYAAIRLPVAAGLRTEAAYLDNTPGIQDAFYQSCGWLTDRLQPGERYLSLAALQSYYCPQAAAIAKVMPDEHSSWLVRGALGEPTPAELADRLERFNVTYIFRQTVTRDRENATASLVTGEFDPGRFRFGATLDPALARAEPIYTGPFASIWRTSDILPFLREATD
jgi:hypothetical protein